MDGFDQQLYTYVVPTVIAAWGMSTGKAGTIGTVTVVTSSFGGWFAGALADRFGRVRVLQIAILWYSIHPARLARPRLRRRVGHRCRADGEVIRDKYRGRGTREISVPDAIMRASVIAGIAATLIPVHFCVT